MTARGPGCERTATVRYQHGCCSYHRFAIRPPYGRLKETVRSPYDFLGTQDRVKTVCHLTSIARPPYGLRTVILRCGCGVAFSEKGFNVRFKKPQGLWWPCGELKTVRSPYGLLKKRKAAVRLRELRSLYGRRKHAASYMWPGHK